MLLVWALVEAFGNDASSAAKGILLMVAPWVLIAAGYDFANRHRSTKPAMHLVTTFAILAGVINIRQNGELAPLALMSVAALLVISRAMIEKLATATLLSALAVLLTTGGSRTALLFASMQGGALLAAGRSASRRLLSAVAVAVAASIGIALLQNNELLRSKIVAGLDEMVPAEFDADGFGGASNLRGYEAALVIRWYSESAPHVLLFGGGPASYLDSGLPILSSDDPTRLFVFHNALFTYIVKFGIFGTGLVLVSFTLLAARLIKIGGAEGVKIALMLAVASVVDGGGFSYVWIAVLFCVGVFMNVQGRYGARDEPTAG